MKFSTACKPLLLAAALALAGGAFAATRALPQGVPGIYFVGGAEFDDTFTFSVSSHSSLLGGIGSTTPDSGIPFPPVTFSALSLTGPAGTVSTPLSGSSAMFSYSNLVAGDYSLRLTGNAQASGIGFYSMYGNIGPVPEPESYAMFLAGLGIIGAMVRRRSN